jgi:uncharacterized repeat protein (TIGR03803 family)
MVRFTFSTALATILGAAAPFFVVGNGRAETPHHKVVVLYQFSGADGSEPSGPLIADRAGNLYGTTVLGGNGAGVVFELSPGHGRKGGWTETVLHNFNGADGTNPLGGLAMDAQGNLYGTAFSDTVRTGGVVFELSPGDNNGWTFTQLYGFDGQDSPSGANPNGGVIRDASGNLYGTTQYGGEHCACGTVFEVSPQRGGGWSESVLYSFRNKPDGAYPWAGLIADSSGDLFGTTNQGGDGHCGDGEGDKSGCGTVFSLTSSQSGWSETLLQNFQRHENNMPYTPVTLGSDGALYGTVGYDVFRLVPPGQGGAGWTKQTLYGFKEGTGGTITSSGVIFDAQGNLYGVTSSSGLDGVGTAYELSPPTEEGGTWTKTTLAKFAKGFDSNQPRGSLLIGADGTLYGAVNGDPGYVFAIEH